MPVERVTEKWKNSVNITTIGSGDSAINVGGEATLPFLYDEGSMPYQPAIALEIYDMVPEGWPEALCHQLGGVINDPVAWAKKGQDEWGVDLICLRLLKPSVMETYPEESVEIAKAIKDAIDIPMIL